MKSGDTLLIAAVAFAVGAFTPYFYLKGKIDETNIKVDSFIESVNTSSEKTEDYQPIADHEVESTSPSENVNDVSDQNYDESASVKITDMTNL